MKTLKQAPGVIRDPIQQMAAAHGSGEVMPARSNFYDLIKLSPVLAGGLMQALR